MVDEEVTEEVTRYIDHSLAKVIQSDLYKKQTGFLNAGFLERVPRLYNSLDHFKKWGAPMPCRGSYYGMIRYEGGPSDELDYDLEMI